jgi:putative transposase
VCSNWVRSKVNQKGGMGILERLNRTFEHAWLFRHEYATLLDVQVLASSFMHWYNCERRHSTLVYATTWSVLSKTDKVRLVPS